MYCRMQKSIAVCIILANLCGAQKIKADTSKNPVFLPSTPIVFIENKGQINNHTVKYCFYGKGANIYHTTKGPVFELISQNNDKTTSISATFPGSIQTIPTGQKQQKTTINYHIGSNHKNGLFTYSEVVYPGIYSGIDLHTFSKRSCLKYEFHVAPGADHSRIAIRYDGINRVFTDSDGLLHIITPCGELIDKPPYVYQMVDEKPKEIRAKYRLIDEKTYGFEIIDDIDRNLQLVIDPELTWVSFVGTNDYDSGQAIVTDSVGNILITGETRAKTFYEQQTNGGADVFVACINPEGQLEWTTFFGGKSSDSGFDIAVDSADNIVVTGFTFSDDFAYLDYTTFGGSSDAFAVKLDVNGNLLWATYLGGGKTDYGFGVAVDAVDNVVVTGYTESADFGNAINSHGGSSDGFVAVISPEGLSQWVTYVGGRYSDQCESVAIDSSNNYVVAGTSSLSILPGAVNSNNGAADAFVSVVGSDGTIQWSSFLGGSSTDHGLGVAISASGRILVSGDTDSKDFTGATNSNYGQKDGFVGIVDPDGTVISATYIGGSKVDMAAGICEDIAGNIIVTGRSNSTDLANADNVKDNGYDAIAAALSPGGALLVSTYLGGGGDDLGFDLTVDESNFILITGASSSTNFGEPGQKTDSSRDGFIAKIMGIDNNMPDLVVTYTQEGIVGIAGESVTVEVEIENTGISDAVAYGPGYFETVLYLSAESGIDWDNLSEEGVGSFDLTLLESGGRYPDTIEFILPDEAGVYYLRARADDFDSVPESREYNNWGQVVTVIVGKAPGEADLIVSELDEDEDTTITAYQGETAKIAIQIENIGENIAEGPDGSDFFTGLYITDDPNAVWEELTTEIAPFGRPILAAGGVYSTEVEITAPVEPGTYYIRAMVDDTGVVGESDETNNWGQILTLEVEKLPGIADMVILDKEGMVITSSPGERVNLLVEIQNIGDANAIGENDEGIDLALYLSNYPGGNQDETGRYELSMFGPGEIRSSMISFDAPDYVGSYYLISIVDDLNVVEESSEENNWGSVMKLVVEPNSLPDLMVSFTDANDIVIRPEEIVDVSVAVINMGGRDAVPDQLGYFDTIVYLANEPNANWGNPGDANTVGTVRIGSLEPAESGTSVVSFMAPFEYGTYYLRAGTDVDDTVIEGNEYNNWSLRRSLIVTEAPMVNYPPELESIPNRAVDEGKQLSFGLVAMDENNDVLSFSSDNLPIGAVLTGSIFDWTPDYEQEDEYVITFNVSDGEFTDSQETTITVKNSNRSPFFSPVESKIVDENQQLVFGVTANDPDGDSIIYTADKLPPGATFIDRIFSWTPGYRQAGDYLISFIASDLQPSDSQGILSVVITVNDVQAMPLADAGEDQTVTDIDGDGFESIILDAKGSHDPDGSIQEYDWQVNGLSSSESMFTVSLPLGSHIAKLTVTDNDGNKAEDTVSVIVKEVFVNSAPKITPISDKTVSENLNLSFNVIADYPDGDTVTISASNLPEGAFFVGNVFNWTPGYNQDGQYEVTFHANDGESSDSESVSITVINTNRAPDLDAIGDRSIPENQELSFSINASDPDGSAITYWVSNVSNLPDGSSFDRNTFSWTPDNKQSGQYDVTFFASDGQLVAFEKITITVVNSNRSPVADAGIDKTVNDTDGNGTEFVRLDGTGSVDLDDDISEYAWEDESGNVIANGAKPGLLFSLGVHIVTLTVTDSEGVRDTDTVRLFVNQLPIADAGYDITVEEDISIGMALVTLDGSASSDPDGSIERFRWEINGEIVFGDYLQVLFSVGSHTVILIVSDDAGADTEDTVNIVVTSSVSNSAPVIAPVGDRAVVENNKLSFSVTANDNDGDEIVYSALNLPGGATFEDGVFNFRPWYDQAGIYEVTFEASDGETVDSQTITIDIEEVSLPAWYRHWLETNGLLNK